MSTAQERSGDQYPTPGTFGHDIPERADTYADYERYEGSGQSEVDGSTALAAWLMIIGGIWSFFLGLAVVIRKAYFTSQPNYAAVSSHYAFNWNLTGWGWANLILGIVVVAAGGCVLLGQTWARVTGIVLAVISAVGTFLFLPYYPIWSIVVIAIDVFIIWALATARRHQPV
ncbi:MAG: hypothetical protein ACLQFR_27095 [Streptosporangiaceae bacterium]